MIGSPDKKKVVLGLSGGVDSTAAALLLKEKGLEVTGLYFDVIPSNEEGRARAETAARQLGIDFVYKNVCLQFQDTVIENFCGEYLKGRTPNPCIVCNPAIKFKTLIEEADKLGAYYVATGHYAKAVYEESLQSWLIKRAINEKKDQSYMLYRLGQEVISRLLLPLADMEQKEEARELARENRLANADAKDSQEICFIEDDQNYIDYIKSKGYSIERGDFINKDGERLGQHQGLVNYTVGQRKGLGITFGKPVFVTKLDYNNNTVTLGAPEDLFSSQVVSQNNFFPMTGSGEFPKDLTGQKILAKIRYAAKPAEAQINPLPGGRVETVFAEKQRAATPGQSIVFYLNDAVIGGGFIE